MSEIADCQHPDTTKCRVCAQDRVKTFGYIAANKRTVWIDEFGERWYGKRCPKCYKHYKRKYDKSHRVTLGYRPWGTYYSCQNCGERFIVKLGSTKLCKTCNIDKLTQAKKKAL